MEQDEILDNSGRAKKVIVIFWIIIGVNLIGVVSGLFELDLLHTIKSGTYVSDYSAEMNDLRQGFIGIIQFCLLITSIVFFLQWFRRAYCNLHRIGVKGLKNSESMAIWSWFIPIISLFLPVRIMCEIWKKTQSKISEFDSSFKKIDISLFITLWWILFIISNYIGNLSFEYALMYDTIDDIIMGSQLTLLFDALHIPEALLVILIVTSISKLEVKLYEEIHNNSDIEEIKVENPFNSVHLQ